MTSVLHVELLIMLLDNPTNSFVVVYFQLLNFNYVIPDRDEVNKGPIYQVLLYELYAIRKIRIDKLCFMFYIRLQNIDDFD